MSNTLNNTFVKCKLLDVFSDLKCFRGDKLLNVTKKVYSPTTWDLSVLHQQLQAPRQDKVI